MARSPGSQEVDVQALLERELARLEKIFGIDDRLVVRWVPDGPPNIAGEVKGKTVLIYEIQSEEAIRTLRHEIVDYLICKIVGFYKEIANCLILLLNEKAYREKEALVERLCRMLED